MGKKLLATGNGRCNLSNRFVAPTHYHGDVSRAAGLLKRFPTEKVLSLIHIYIQAEDFGAILIRFKNGAIGIVEGTACVYPKNLEETLSIFGGTGTAVIGGLAVNRVQTWNFETPAPQDEEVAQLAGNDPKDVYGSGHTPLYANYIQAIHNGVDPRCV